MTERTMPPCGHGRDALVAELVFGMPGCNLDDHADFQRHSHRPGSAQQHGWWRDKWEDNLFHKPWSTDNHAALDLLMEMQRRGYRFVIHWMNQPWTVSVWSPLFRSSMATGEELNGETFPDAVSAAVIRAIWAEQGAQG